MKKILIIDDNEDILDSLSILLEDQGYVISTFTKGEDAVKKAFVFSPDLIILDLLLSGKDGCDIVKLLRKFRTTKKIPIIMMSAHPSAEKSAKNCGADDFLAKPFDIDELLGVVRKYSK